MKRVRLLTISGLVVGVVAAVAAAMLLAAPAKGAAPSETAPAVQAALPSADALSSAFERVADQASPAVVFIEVEKEMKGMPASFFGPGTEQGDPGDFFRHFFFGPGQGFGPQSGPGFGPQGGQERGMPHGMPMPMGQGSGFVISPDGYIVTNHHVVGDADHVRVTLSDGRKFDAKLAGSDPETEIALIKVDATGLPTIPLGDSDQLRVGEWVLAIGSPFGLEHSVTSGIVSARGRGNVGIVDYADFIQTDAAINPGNSGGPLLNMKGEVIGMNTAIVSRTGGSNGVGFAIPVNMIKYISDQLRNHGTIARGYLGISIQNLTPDLAKWFGLEEGHGVLVADVAKDSPAERAGLKRDDVIVEFNGQPVQEAGSFRSRVATTAPGVAVEMAIMRDGKRVTKTIDIGTLPGEHVAMNTGPQEQAERTDVGLAVQPLTDDLAKRLGYEGEHGVVVSEVTPGSEAARAGIREGDLIKEVNRQEVDNPRDFQQALKKGDKAHTALLLLQEGQGTRYATLNVA
jgi:serine protease Do